MFISLGISIEFDKKNLLNYSSNKINESADLDSHLFMTSQTKYKDKIKKNFGFTKSCYISAFFCFLKTGIFNALFQLANLIMLNLIMMQ